MSKRQRRQQTGPAWLSEETESASLQEVTAQGYGLDISPTGQRIVARPTSIFDIAPDPGQPRRAVPSFIREQWDGSPEGIKDMFTLWWGAVQEERARLTGQPDASFDLGRYLEGGETPRSDPEAAESDGERVGPVEASFLRIVTLAASIRRDGLTNPVTVAPEPDGSYRLETGERRWLAYHLLHAWFDGADGHADESDRWGMIPARKVDTVDVWRQASENNARDDLNAIGKARQYAVLMMAMHGVDQFKPLAAFEGERAYYAQVLALRGAPYGRGEDLLNALGVSSRSVLTRLRHLLTLPDVIWHGGDDFNLPEDTLVALARTAQKDPDRAVQQYEQIVLSQNNSGASAAAPAKRQKVADPGTKDHFAAMMRALTRAGKGRHKDNAQALKALRELRDWIDREEDRISQFIK